MFPMSVPAFESSHDPSTAVGMTTEEKGRSSRRFGGVTAGRQDRQSQGHDG
jgi:hypothetical protein